ncbi:MAG: DUF4352 domain-containing protein [Lachnospiraceae bacterium]|nr:DUF4352 domain-containing protein [Lachnospiraceae bacterium]
MKKYYKYVLLGTVIAALGLTGCGSDSTTDDKTEATATPTQEAANEGDATATPTDEAASVGVGEGANMVTTDGTVSAENAKENEIGKEITIAKDGKELYTITIDSVALTKDRNDFDETQPNQVVKVTYTYKNIAADNLLIDSYSFALEDKDKKACNSYALVGKDDTEPIPAGESLTRTIAYALDSADKDVTLYYNATSGDNSIYAFPITVEEEK